MRKILLLSIAAIVAFASCSKISDGGEAPIQEDGRISLVAKMPEQVSTRVGVDVGANEYVYKWKSYDKVLALGVNAAATAFTGRYAFYTVTNPGGSDGHFDIDDKNAGFSDGEKFIVVHAKYAIDDLVYNSPSAITLPTTTTNMSYQMPTFTKTAADDLSNLENHLLFVSAPVTASSVSVPTFQLTPVMSILKVSVRASNAASPVRGRTLSGIELTSEDAASLASVLQIKPDGTVDNVNSTWVKTRTMNVDDAAAVIGSTDYTFHMLASMKQGITAPYAAFSVKSGKPGQGSSSTIIFKAQRVLAFNTVIPTVLDCGTIDDFIIDDPVNFQEWDTADTVIREDI